MRYALIALLLIPALACAATEDDYNRAWCAAHNGQAEVVLADRTRADCITHTHAIEADYARKFYGAIGQSLWYAFQTSKRAGIVLIVDPADNGRYLYRLNSVIRHNGLPIDVWTVTR